LVEVVFPDECECDGSEMEDMKGVVVVAINLRWGGGGGCGRYEL
jgi:hypothetical protein